MSPWLHRPNKPRRSDRIKKLDAGSYVETSLYTRAAVSKKAPAMKASIRTTLANKTPAQKDSSSKRLQLKKTPAQKDSSSKRLQLKKFSSPNGDDKSEVDEMQDARPRKLQTRKFQ
jgi:hypothetical protein